MSFAKLIKEAREQQGKTLEQVAAATGLSVTSVYQYEKGLYADPKRKTVYAFAEALNIPLRTLIGCEGTGKRKIEFNILARGQLGPIRLSPKLLRLLAVLTAETDEDKIDLEM